LQVGGVISNDIFDEFVLGAPLFLEYVGNENKNKVTKNIIVVRNDILEFKLFTIKALNIKILTLMQ
jgi:hypothetical protein